MLEKEIYKFTAEELLKLYAKNYKTIARSMNARERKAKENEESNGWKYTQNTSYQLWKELKQFKPSTIKALSRNEILHMVKTSSTILENKYHTLSATEKQIKKQEREFAKRNYDTIRELLEKEGGRGKITDKMIRTRMKDISNDKQYYDFLHSEEYKRLTEKYKMESGDLQRDYLLNMDNALEHYSEYLERLENEEIEFNERELLIENPFED